MSLRKAIDDKCRDCIHDTAAPGTWREQVAQCSCITCPLWPYRVAGSGRRDGDGDTPGQICPRNGTSLQTP